MKGAENILKAKKEAAITKEFKTVSPKSKIALSEWATTVNWQRRKHICSKWKAITIKNILNSVKEKKEHIKQSVNGEQEKEYRCRLQAN